MRYIPIIILISLIVVISGCTSGSNQTGVDVKAKTQLTVDTTVLKLKGELDCLQLLPDSTADGDYGKLVRNDDAENPNFNQFGACTVLKGGYYGAPGGIQLHIDLDKTQELAAQRFTELKHSWGWDQNGKTLVTDHLGYDDVPEAGYTHWNDDNTDYVTTYSISPVYWGDYLGRCVIEIRSADLETLGYDTREAAVSAHANLIDKTEQLGEQIKSNTKLAEFCSS